MARFESPTNTVVLCIGVFACGLWISTASVGARIGLHQPPSALAQSARLDEASLAEAVRLGEVSEPAPYLLYHPDSDEATMAVYTPFVRVAMAAHTARQRGERLDPSTLPRWVVERDIHIVIRPADRSAAMARLLYPTDPPLAETPITHIGLQRRDSKLPLQPIPPRWTTTDLSYLSALGGRPFPDAVAAAGFDPDLMTAGLDVYAFWQKQNDFFPSVGLLEPEVTSRWR